MKRALAWSALLVCVGGICLSVQQAQSEEAGLELLDIHEWHWPGESVECVPHLVGPRDTLTSIAAELYPHQDTNLMIWAIRRANGLEDSVLMPGQVLWIPDPRLSEDTGDQFVAGGAR